MILWCSSAVILRAISTPGLVAPQLQMDGTGGPEGEIFQPLGKSARIGVCSARMKRSLRVSDYVEL
jgi:hypothetical protein